jgi:hypothetical protein
LPPSFRYDELAVLLRNSARQTEDAAPGNMSDFGYQTRIARADHVVLATHKAKAVIEGFIKQPMLSRAKVPQGSKFLVVDSDSPCSSS